VDIAVPMLSGFKSIDVELPELPRSEVLAGSMLRGFRGLHVG
jgi:hypothetical protein